MVVRRDYLKTWGDEPRFPYGRESDMAVSAESQRGKYLYAIVPATGQRAYDLVGIDGAPVYAIANGRVAAVVSDIPNAKIRPERRHLAAQQAVLQGLLASTDAILPMAFGIIAAGPKAIQATLSRHHEVFLKQLLRVAGMVEMGLRVSWDVPNIFEYFIHTHPDLRVARDRFLGPYRNPSQEDKIELGRLFDRLLKEDRENYTDQVADILSPYCREIKRHPCRNESEVMNLACLVRSQGQDSFEAGVFAAARLFDNNFSFDYNGPWAPHNFVELDLKL
ncbi:MAG: GvpL/GvpF family gas vesicle protein [Deltaproteobacteria bacterium]|nr:GvpL/GvpF family gas vesicle protein [Deltaproteobacteria bacterium]